jgi:hypothetical protein
MFLQDVRLNVSVSQCLVCCLTSPPSKPSSQSNCLLFPSSLFRDTMADQIESNTRPPGGSNSFTVTTSIVNFFCSHSHVLTSPPLLGTAGAAAPLTTRPLHGRHASVYPPSSAAARAASSTGVDSFDADADDDMLAGSLQSPHPAFKDRVFGPQLMP